jgi:hypothetical protein
MSQTQTLATAGQTASTQEWKAFINMMPSPDRERTLVVTGGITGDSRTEYKIVPAEPQGINPRILILEVQPDPRGTDEVALRYEQKVAGPDQYTSIVVRIAGQEDVVIKEIGKAF